MKLKTILTNEFAESFSNLMDGGILILSPKIVKRIKQISKKIKEEYNQYEEMRKEFLEKLADKDENGNAIIKNKAYSLSEENTKIFNKKQSELLETEFSIGEMIAYKDIEKLSLKTKDIIVLEDIINDPTE